MLWTADEIRRLRYRLGWSRAEMARCLKLGTGDIMQWELGTFTPGDAQKNALLMILQQAESNAERVQRRPIADVMMRDRGLLQIHDLDVVDGLDLKVRIGTSARKEN